MFACCFPTAKSILTAVPPSHLPSANATASANASASAPDIPKDGLKAAEAVSTSQITACTAAAMTFSSTEVAVKLVEAKATAAKLDAAISSAEALTGSLNNTVAAAIAATFPEGDEDSDNVITEFSDTDEEVAIPEPPKAEKL